MTITVSGLHSRFFRFRFQLLMNPKPLSENLRDANELGIELLLTDAEMGLTLLNTAQISKENRRSPEGLRHDSASAFAFDAQCAAQPTAA